MATSSGTDRPRAIVSWSSGKDSAWALHTARESGTYEIVGLLTTLTRAHGRVAMHGVREDLLQAQAAALGLELRVVELPAPCSNEIYERAFGEALAEARCEGVTHVVFGDLFLADLREYREAQLARYDLRAVFPLWGRPTRELALELIEAGVDARLSCVDPRRVSASLAGRRFDRALLAELGDADPCGENGEFHTFVVAGPMFSRAIEVVPGEIVEREGFVFADFRSLGS